MLQPNSSLCLPAISSMNWLWVTDLGPVPRAGTRASAAAGGGGKLFAQANKVMNEALFSLKYPKAAAYGAWKHRGFSA